jgi:hypothetical protein
VPEPHLRVVTVNEQGQVDEQGYLPSDYLLLVEENRKLIREKAALKGQLTKLRKVDPQAETIEGLLVYWRNRLRGPASTVDISLDGKRADKVRKAIARCVEADQCEEGDPVERAAERIRTAIDGCAMFPFEGAYGRRFSEQVKGSIRKDDLAYVLRDGPKQEQFEALREADEKRIAYARDLHRRLLEQPNLKALLATFDPEMCEILCRAIRWAQS